MFEYKGVVTYLHNIKSECNRILNLARHFEETGNQFVANRLFDIANSINFEADSAIQKHSDDQSNSLKTAKELASLSLGAALKHFNKEEGKSG